MDEIFSGNQRFEIIRRLGKGGMGVVYEALDRENRTRVALKTLRYVSGEDLLRLKYEFRALQDLQHENLVRLEELLEHQGHYFFTMELIDGCDFLEYVTAHPNVSGSPDTLANPAMFVDSFAEVPDTEVEARGLGAAARRWHGQGIYDPERLSHALRQLASGLDALHEAGKVHRDIKPSNCLVARDGRLVILDFGLVISASGDERWSQDDVVGTVAYMAPEQAASMQVGPEADLYSVGVMLYEALTGALPFSGGALEVLAKKQLERPPAPRELVADIPPVLDALCIDLIAINPSKRPSAAQVLDRLDAIDSELGLGSSELERKPRSSPARPGSLTGSHALPFVGRAQESQALAQAFADTQRGGRATTVLLTGESGLGKTTLARRFLARLPLENAGAVVLAGRCYEQEAVPYKALDGVIDELSLFLSRMPAGDATALVPRRAQLLCQMFPVLGRVPAIANAPRQPGEIRDPHELRGRVFAALRELLARLADRHPLAIYIDDIQWSDADSLVILSELLRPPDAPRLLLLATARDVDPGTPAAAVVDSVRALPGEVRELRIERLSADESQELARRLLLTIPGVDADIALAIARESGGHPMFIDELIRHAATGPRAGAHVSLEQALWARICSLEADDRELLRVVSIASGPLVQRVARAAAELSPAEFARASRVLRTGRLARTTGGRSSDLIEIYHDRVGAAVRAHMAKREQIHGHRALAEALEAGGGDAEALAYHWRAAGERDRAARHAARAAVQAGEALAFDRAADHYRRALELSTLSPDDIAELCVGLGDALTAAGRGGEAAGAYLDAARVADDEDSVDLRRRAAEQLLRSGHIEEGFRTLRDVLTAVDLDLPDTRRGALGAILKHRAWLRLHGLRYRERSELELSRDERIRIDVCWSVAAGLAMVDPIVGYEFHSLNLRLSLIAGEPYRLARALSMEAIFLAARGASGREVQRVRQLAGELADRCGRPHAQGLVTMARGMDYFWRGHWKPAVEWLDRADRVFSQEWTGLVAGSPTSRVLALWSLFYLGELESLFQRLSTQLREAVDRGDLQVAVNLGAGVAHLHTLALDQPERAADDVTAHLETWRAETFHFQHFVALIANTDIDLYRGDPAKALARLDVNWPELRDSHVFRTRKLRIDGYLARARAALMAARDASGAGGESGDAGEHLRTARQALRKVEREKAPWATPIATLGRAALADLGGDPERAAALLGAAAAGFREVNMELHERAAHYRLGVLRGGTRGRATRRETEVWLEKRGVVRPIRYLRFIAPGFAEPED